MAIRIDAVGDALTRTANLPTNTAFTILVSHYIVSNIGAGTIQPVVWALDGGSTDGYALQWNVGSGVMSLEAYDGGAPSSNTSFGSRPAVGTPYRAYIRCSGNGAGQLSAGWRGQGDAAFTSVTATLAATIAQVATLYFGGVAGAYYANGRYADVKCWDRALSDSELLVESFYDFPQHPTNLNFWWPLHTSSDTADRSGNGRNPTVGGTLTTEDTTFALWRPRIRMRRRVAAAAATAGQLVNAGRLKSLVGGSLVN